MWNASARNIVTISAPIHERISSGSLACVSAPCRRLTRCVRRRKSAKATAAITSAPHRSWLAVKNRYAHCGMKRAKLKPGMTPATRNSLVPAVRTQKPQKIAACMGPATESRKIFFWKIPISMRLAMRRGT